MTGAANSGGRPLRELAGLFLRLGATAFGGPAAHIAMMEDEVVRRRGWLSRDEFLDLLGATNLIPGPNSTEMAIHVGYRRAGAAGLLVAGSCFILPAALLVTLIAWAYVRFGRLPEAAALLYGIKPVIIAVVLQALWRLGRTALKDGLLAVIALIAAGLNATGVNELAVLFGAGLAVLAFRRVFRSDRSNSHTPRALWGPFPALTAGAAGTGGAAVVGGASLGPLFLVFLKIGSVLFGSGYVLLAFLRSDLVQRLHWLTESQLLDAVAVGQVTPGPVFTTATFIGYVLAGAPGAVAATVGIFLPAFFFVAVSGPFLPRLRKSPAAGAFLDGLNAASLALMAVVTWQLGQVALVDLPTAVLAAVSAVLLLRFQVSATWLVIGGALAGLALGAGAVP
jgi:chromate transporter